MHPTTHVGVKPRESYISYLLACKELFADSPQAAKYEQILKRVMSAREDGRMTFSGQLLAWFLLMYVFSSDMQTKYEH